MQRYVLLSCTFLLNLNIYFEEEQGSYINKLTNNHAAVDNVFNLLIIMVLNLNKPSDSPGYDFPNLYFNM